jgi:hypothetical protein
MRCLLGQEWNGATCDGEPARFNWHEALQVTEAINRQGGYAGFRDWRLPTNDELLTLVYCSSGQPKNWNDTGGPCQGSSERPTIYQPAFPNTLPCYVWSTQIYSGQKSCTAVHFGNGQADASIYHAYHSVCVRLVRGTLLLGGRYQDHGDGTVTDVDTGLQWMRCLLGQTWKDGTCIGEANKYTLDAAFQAAEFLNRKSGYSNYHDWRLPAREELLTLIYCSSERPKIWNNTGKVCQGKFERPTIYQPAFPNMSFFDVWSASDVDGSYNAWYVNFDDGYAESDYRSNNYCVRLVRGESDF